MNESITFPEDDIREVVNIIREGLKATQAYSLTLKENLEKQCDKLEEYRKELQEAD